MLQKLTQLQSALSENSSLKNKINKKAPSKGAFFVTKNHVLFLYKQRKQNYNNVVMKTMS